MHEIPEGRWYTAEHEWATIADGHARIGITAYAQEQLGDVVYVELPRAGDKLTAAGAFGVVESVKAASDLYSPVTGTVTEVNERLGDEPELVNSDPYGDGWMVVVELADMAEIEGLLDAAAYARVLAGSEEAE